MTSDLKHGDRVVVFAAAAESARAYGTIGSFGRWNGDGGAVYAVDVCFDDGDTIGFNLFPDGLWRKNKLGMAGAAFKIERRP